MHGPYSKEGSWVQLFRGALSPNDAPQKIIRVRNTYVTVHLADISTKGKAKQYIAVFFFEFLVLPEVSRSESFQKLF